MCVLLILDFQSLLIYLAVENNIIVFDFDKTLTYNDTLFGFFIHSCKTNILFPFKVTFYFAIMILAKINLISNYKLKQLGILIFLKDQSPSFVSRLSDSYKRKIKFNKLFYQYNFNQSQKLYVVTASFEEYIQNIFPTTVTIVGSQIQYKSEVVSGLKFNCYNNNKIDALAKAGVFKIKELYTDSYSDFPLANISDKIVIVSGDNLHVCNNIKEFNTYFGKSNS